MNYELDFTTVWQYRALLAEGLLFTLQMFLLSQFLATAIGLGTALFRLSRHFVIRLLSAVYLEFFRNTPILVQLVWMFYVLPVLISALIPGGPYNIPTFWIGVIALSIHIGAYLTEVFRAGILTVNQGQIEAARTLGMSTGQIFRRIVLPQAIVTVIPPYLNMAVVTLKLTALVSIIGGVDFLYVINQINQVAYRSIELYTVAALLYFLLALPFLVLVTGIERRIRSRWRI